MRVVAVRRTVFLLRGIVFSSCFVMFRLRGEGRTLRRAGDPRNLVRDAIAHLRVEFPRRGCDPIQPVARAQTSANPKLGKENLEMTIKVGDKLPAGTLQEFYEEPKDGCAVGPNPVKVDELTKGHKVVIFGLPGAFTPTCSAKHVPSFLANYDKLKSRGVDTIACMAVNDAFVMGAWGRDQKTGGKIRMLADGSGDYTKALGLEFDLS